MLECLSEGIHVVECASQIILFTNPALDAMFGYARGDLVGKCCFDLLAVPPAELPALEAAIRSDIQAHGHWFGQTPKRRKDGSVFYSPAHIRRVQLDGRSCYLTVETDLTQRQQAEASLRESEVRFRTLFDHSPIAICEADFSGVEARLAELGRAGVLDFRAWLEAHPEELPLLLARVRVTTANQCCAEMFGAASKEQFLAGWHSYFSAASLPVFREHVIALAEGKTRLQSELPLVNARGEALLVDLNLSVELGYEASLTRVLVSLVDITARTQAEAALRASEERHRRLLEILPDACIVLDREGRITSANQRTLELHGFASPQEVLGQSAMEFVAPDEAEFVRGRLRRAAEGESLAPADYTMRRTDGTTFPAEVITTALRDASGAVEGYLSIGRDVTVRRQAEARLREARDTLERRVAERTAELRAANEALRASEALLRAAFDNAPFEFWVRDLAGVAIMQNQAAATHYGRSVGQRAEETSVPPETRAIWLANNERALAGETVQGEIALHEPGGVRWLHNVVAPFLVEEQVRGILGFNFDITERKRTEHALQKSEARYRRLHESMTDAFVSVGMDGVIRDFNRAYQAMLGYPEAELRRLTYEDLTPAKWHAGEARIVAEQIKPRGYSDVYEKEYRRPDGSVFPVELRTFLLRDEAGEMVEMWAIVRDITRRRQAEAAIRELNATLEQRVQERTVELERANADLRASEAWLRLAAQAGQVGFWGWDLCTEEVYFSPEWKRQLGYADHELPNAYLEWERRLHPEDRAAALRELAACRAEPGHDIQIEFRLQHRDGSYRHILARGSVIRGLDGQPLRMLGAHLDFTARRAAEEQIRQLSRAVAQSPASVVITDVRGNIEYVNSKFTAVTGYRLDEVHGRNPRLLKSGNTAPAEHTRLWQAITSGREWHGELLNRRKDGALFWELASISPVVDSAGRITHFVAVKEDITEHKAAQARLSASELRFRTLFEAAPVAMALHGADGGYLQINPAYAQMLGYSREELLRLSTRQVTHPEDVAEGQRFYGELCRGSLTRYQRDKRFLRPDGRTVWAHSAASAVRDEAGQLRFIISIVEDRTAQKRAADCAAAFAKLGLALSAATNPNEAAQNILDTASALFDWDACFLNLVSSEDGRLLWLVRVDTIHGAKITLPSDGFGTVPKPLSQAIMREGARLINLPTPSFNVPGQPPLSPFGDTDRPSASMMYVPIRRGGQPVGVLSLQSYTPNAYRPPDLDTLQALADHCGGAIERIATERALRRLEHQVVEAGNREQTRIGCELHDGVAQTLGGLALRAKLLTQTLAAAGHPGAAEAEAFTRLLNQAMSDTRRLASGLAPVGLELEGLPAALARLSLDAAAAGKLTCPFTCNVAAAQIQPGVALHLFRLAQEAVANALRHARPQRISLTLTADGPSLQLAVRDDGAGFDTSAPATGGMGLNSMRYRANVIGARLTVHSQPGHGTEIQCLLAEASRWQATLSQEKMHEPTPKSRRAAVRPRPRRR